MRSAAAFVFAFLLLLISGSKSSIAQQTDRIRENVDDRIVTRIPHSVHPAIAGALDRGRVNADLVMQRMVLTLKPSQEQETALTKLTEEQNDPASANYRKWLTPEDYAARFGISDKDLESVKAWLEAKGFAVERIARGRQWIQFTGTVAQVESAFQTEMHRYAVAGQEHIANATDISIPSALQPVVEGVRSLHDFRGRALHTPLIPIHRDPLSGQLKIVRNEANPNPFYTTGGGDHLVAPSDWAHIYNTQPLRDEGLNGEGITIAVVGTDTNIQLSDIRTFRQIFGLPQNDPDIIIDGTDPGFTPFNSFEVEADLDVEWSGAIAPKAKVEFVTASSTITSFGFELALAHIIDNRLAPITTVSIGSCELFLGDSGNAYMTRLYRQAVAEGITIVVAAGDTGLAGCDPQVKLGPAYLGPMVNGSASTAYDVAVGGTMFDENGFDGTFWASANRDDHSSAIGYIPEQVWNESCDPTVDPGHCGGSGDYYLSAGSGGASNCTRSTNSGIKGFTCYGGYAKPTWQSATGVPDDGARDLPDISLNAGSNHDGYIVCAEGSCQTIVVGGKTVITNGSVIGGTSAGAPSFAGALALLEEKERPFQGLINFNLYKIARAEKLASCNSSKQTDPTHANSCVFYDIASGDNTVPGLGGARAVSGFDLASGLGSINFANLVAKWDTAPKASSKTTLSIGTTMPVTHGSPVSLQISVAPVSGGGVISGIVSLLLSNGTAITFSQSLTNGEWSGTVSDLPAGTYQLRASYPGNVMFEPSSSAPISVTVLPEDAKLTAQAWIAGGNAPIHPIDDGRASYGNQFGLQVHVTGQSGIGVGTGKFTILYDSAQSFGPYLLNAEGNDFVFLTDHSAEGIPPGKHTFQVFYQGDASLNPVSGAPIPITVYKDAIFLNMLFSQADGWVDENIPQLYTGVPYDIVLVTTPPDFGSLGRSFPTGTVRLYECSDTFCTSSKPLTGDLPLAPNGYLPSSLPEARIRMAFPVGFHQLVATYSGDRNYGATRLNDRSSGRFSITVSPKPPVLVQLTQASPSVPLGHAQTYTLTVKNAAGSLSTTKGWAFLADPFGASVTDRVPVTSGTAQFSLPQNNAGQPVYWALFYVPGADPIQVSSNGVATIVPRGSTTTTVSPASISGAANGRVNITATVTTNIATLGLSQPGSEGGQVVFYDSVNGAPPRVMAGGAQTLTTGTSPTASVHSMAVVLAAGTHEITAKFLGSQDWLPSSSVSTTVVVKQRAAENPGQNTASAQ